jgi:hypothetical protein
VFEELASAASEFGWTHEQLMVMRPRTVRAYLKGLHRVQARGRIEAALIAGYVHLARETQQTLRNLWAQESRGDEMDVDEASGRAVVKQSSVRDWVKALPPMKVG